MARRRPEGRLGAFRGAATKPARGYRGAGAARLFSTVLEGVSVTDELTLTGLACWGHHGVFEHERREGQQFVVDLVLGIDTAAAAASDDLSATVDYGSLALSVKAAVEKDPVDLIETLAHRIAEVCLLDSRVEWARVTVHKPDAPIDATFSDVALTITRTQEGRP